MILTPRLLLVQAVLGHDDCVTAMLEHKASALCRDAQGSTPLHYAASRGHTEILASLVQAAIATDPQDKLLDNKQYTPLHWAAYKGSLRSNSAIKTCRSFQNNISW